MEEGRLNALFSQYAHETSISSLFQNGFLVHTQSIKNNTSPGRTPGLPSKRPSQVPLLDRRKTEAVLFTSGSDTVPVGSGGC